MDIKYTNQSDSPQLKYFMYCRKSSDSEDKQILSLPAQVRELTEYAQKFNLKIVDIYQESQSAFKIGRPQFNQMLERVVAKEGNAILVWQANRIARNSKDSGDFIYLMDEEKLVELRTPSKSYLNTPNDKFTLSIEFTMAKKDSDDKSENVKRGNREKFFVKKQWGSLAKPGWLNVVDPLSKEHYIEKDPLRFPLLSKAIKLILNGTYTPMQTLNILNEDWAYRSRLTRRQGGKPMTKSGWYKILSDPFLYGLMIRKEGEVMAGDLKMLTAEEYQRLQIILGRKGRPHVTKHEFAYKEVLRCGECKGSITCEEKWQIICPMCKTKFHKGKTTNNCPSCKTPIEEMKNPTIMQYIYYHCTKRVNKNCTQGNITLKKLEEKADEALQKFEISEKFKNWAIEHLNELNDKETNDRELVRGNVTMAYNDCVKKLDNLLQLKISPQNVNGSVISDEEYSNQRKHLLLEKDALLENTNATDQRIDRWHELSVKAFNFACYARHWFNNGDLKTKTQILGALGSDLTIMNKKLAINQQKHIFLIEKGKEDIQRLARMLEPAKWLEILSKTDLPDALSSRWLGSMDSDHDTCLQRAMSYR